MCGIRTKWNSELRHVLAMHIASICLSCDLLVDLGAALCPSTAHNYIVESCTRFYNIHTQTVTNSKLLLYDVMIFTKH